MIPSASAPALLQPAAATPPPSRAAGDDVRRPRSPGAGIPTRFDHAVAANAADENADAMLRYQDTAALLEPLLKRLLLKRPCDHMRFLVRALGGDDSVDGCLLFCRDDRADAGAARRLAAHFVERKDAFRKGTLWLDCLTEEEVSSVMEALQPTPDYDFTIVADALEENEAPAGEEAGDLPGAVVEEAADDDTTSLLARPGGGGSAAAPAAPSSAPEAPPPDLEALNKLVKRLAIRFKWQPRAEHVEALVELLRVAVLECEMALKGLASGKTTVAKYSSRFGKFRGQMRHIAHRAGFGDDGFTARWIKTMLSNQPLDASRPQVVYGGSEAALTLHNAWRDVHGVDVDILFEDFEAVKQGAHDRARAFAAEIADVQAQAAAKFAKKKKPKKGKKRLGKDGTEADVAREAAAALEALARLQWRRPTTRISYAS